MKRLRLESLYAALLLLVMAGIVIHAPLSVGFGALFPDQALIVKSWKEILLGIASILAVIIISKRKLWRSVFTDRLMVLIAVYVLLHLILALLIGGKPAAVVAGLLIDLRYIGYFVLVYILIVAAPQYRLRLLITVAIGAMLVAAFGVLQLFLPPDILSHIGYSKDTIAPYLTVDKNPDYVRINSTLRGPNPLGAYMVIVLAMITSLFITARYRLKTNARRWSFAAMALAACIVLWVSYSRSALVGAVVAVVCVPLIVYGRRISHRAWFAAATALVIVLGGLFAARESSFVANVILHDNPSTGAVITSNDGHVSSLLHSAARVATQPLGAGIGSTGSASLLGDNGMIVENQYLFIAHESGWLGLVLFLSIFGLVMVRLWKRRHDWLALGVFASGIGLACIGLLLPVWADDTVAIVWWGLAAIALATRKEEK